MTTHNMQTIPYLDEESSAEYLADSILDDALIGITRAQSLREMWEAEPALLRRQAGDRA